MTNPRLQPREKQIQLEVRRFLEAFGCVVISFSQPRATKQTPGIPDLYCFPPRGRPAFWFEVKTPNGITSEAQLDFEARCRMARIGYARGGVSEARYVLTALGVLFPGPAEV